MPRKSNKSHLTGFGKIILRGITPPACSRLYCIEPVGIGTPLVESLTSYIVRLASAHCVTVGALVTYEIAPLINKDYLLDKTSTGLSTPFILQSRTVNGLGITAAEWANALQALTLQERLRFMTTWPLREFITKNKLLRKYRAWCPDCYEGWQQAGETIYDPLLWAVNAVTICPKHKLFLLSQCIHCNKQIPPLTRAVRPGFCPNCKQWLGVNNISSPRDERLDCNQLRWQAWVYDQLGTIFATASQLSSLPGREIIAALVSACVQKLTRGDLKAFVRRFTSFNYKTIETWLRGHKLPELARLMDLCYQTDVSMKDVLLGKIGTAALLSRVEPIRKSASRYMTITELERMEAALTLMVNEDPPLSLNRAAKYLGWHRQTFQNYFPEFFSIIKERYSTYEAERLDKGKIKSALLAAMDEVPAPSLHSVIKGLGCSNGFLRDKFPEESRIIIERHVESRKVFADSESIRTQFQVLQNEFPPLSISRSAERLGCESRHLSKYFPEIYSVAVARYADYRKANTRKRRETRWQAIITTKMALEAERIPPTRYQIRKRLSDMKNLTIREIDAAINGLSGSYK